MSKKKDNNGYYGRGKPPGAAGRGKHVGGYGWTGGAKHEKVGPIKDCLSAFILIAGFGSLVAVAGVYGLYSAILSALS
jgi:hypothetical protein